MNRAAALFFDLITMIFVVLTVLVILGVVAVASDRMDAPVFPVRETAAPATVAALGTPTPRPTATPSFTPTPSHTPTETATPTPTATPSSTMTPSRTPTATPSHTFTPSATFTPSITPTATLSPTNTLVPPSPTNTLASMPQFVGSTPLPQPTLSAEFPFIVQPGSVIMRQNTGNPAGCNWQGIAGQVTTNTGEPVTGIEVRAVRTTDPDEVHRAQSGSNTAYGTAGWEMVVGSEAAITYYQVSLWLGGVQISPAQDIIFPGQCQQNLVTLNFVQVRAY